MSRFLVMESERFPVLPGEAEKVVNEGMYGEALALYLQAALRERGFEMGAVSAEDWGWWVDVRGAEFTSGVGVYAQPAGRFACSCEPSQPRQWSWRKWRSVDTRQWTERLERELEALFEADPEIRVVGWTDEFPF